GPWRTSSTTWGSVNGMAVSAASREEGIPATCAGWVASSGGARKRTAPLANWSESAGDLKERFARHVGGRRTRSASKLHVGRRQHLRVEQAVEDRDDEERERRRAEQAPDNDRR